ncbi:alpha/beta hydrolase [Spirulina subsalsa FACHB-351]|uniref:Alpha/beta hydrolase n=1 Tax=Spirulina subsalsa FACHB-351 TaxID=234711 RepID=A0ABT3LAB9_9CYAN|nr:alpha/beta hydrolase [Spirulina subsalsa]MCW6038082.1 alpha/beta hydrolase [Spirulina subsalsa FACHB-351]
MPSPDFILYLQHGWADTSDAMQQFGEILAPHHLVIAPNLGWLKTWLRLEPLITQVESQVTATLEQYPTTPLRVIGHSMGGIIWLELLNRHPAWCSHLHSLILLASPIGGADAARIIDPFGLGIGIARDLGINRRALAEKIAQQIPTLVIAGDIDQGSDGTILVASTQFDYSQFIRVELPHPQLNAHPDLIPLIQAFWENPVISPPSPPSLVCTLIQQLRQVEGITDAHPRDFPRSQKITNLGDGLELRLWKNALGVTHVFLGDKQGQCLYGGFVGWKDASGLEQCLEEIVRQCGGREWGIDN